MTEDLVLFDPEAAEEALQIFLQGALGGGVETFPSSTPGVIAFERLDFRDESKIDWAKFQIDMKTATGFNAICVANCDWTFDEKCDEEATLVAFDVPGLPPEYRNDYRNKLPAA